MRDGRGRARAAARRERVAGAALPDLDAELRRSTPARTARSSVRETRVVVLEERAEAPRSSAFGARGGSRSAGCHRRGGETEPRRRLDRLASTSRGGPATGMSRLANGRGPSRPRRCARPGGPCSRRGRRASDVERLGADEAAVEEVACEDAQAVAALLRLAAVRVVDAHGDARRPPRGPGRHRSRSRGGGRRGAPRNPPGSLRRSRRLDDRVVVAERLILRELQARRARADAAKARTGKVSMPFTFTGTAKKRQPRSRQRLEVAQVLDDRDRRGEQRGVRGPRAVARVVDVERVDADQRGRRVAPARAPRRSENGWPST